jgi:hypothetical protein
LRDLSVSEGVNEWNTISAAYLETMGSSSAAWGPVGGAAKEYGKATAAFRKMAEIHPFAGGNGVGMNLRTGSVCRICSAKRKKP